MAQIRALALERRVRFTHKSFQELSALDLGLDETDCCQVLYGLTPEDSCGRIRSVTTGEWMYVFNPTVGGTPLYIKVVLRSACIVVSFHEEDEDAEPDPA